MQPLQIKIHRVREANEIDTLEGLGVDYLGFDVDDDAAFKISDDALWNDDRYVLEEELGELLTHVRKAKPVVQRPVDAISADTLAELADQGVPLLQYQGHFALPEDVESGCERWPVRLIPGGFYVEPDDQRGLSGELRSARPCVAFYELQVFPSYADNAWSFLTASPPRRPEGALGLDDIVDVARSVPLFVSLDITEANAAEIVETLTPTLIAGLSFTLSPETLGSFHTLEFPELTRVLEIVRASRPVS
jgi:hypothetical protein